MSKKRYMPEVVNPVLETGNHWESQEFKKGIHNGEDIINRTNKVSATPCYIIAIADGRVTFTGYTKSRGYYVEIQHNNGMYSRYLHLKEGTIKVKKNNIVTAGTLLGYMGNSGASEGIHLHLAIFSKINGIETYVDPYLYLIDKNAFENKWLSGEYRLLKDKYCRTSPEVANNKIKYKSLMKTIQNKCIKDISGYAKWKTGATIELIDFKFDKKGNLWGMRKGKNTNIWICIHDYSGNQVVKL